MPLNMNGSVYTTRLQMIIDTAMWMYDKFEELGVDIIVNCGDTLDSSVLKADEISALHEFYSFSKGTKEYHIVGNHEMKDNDHNFYSSSILKSLKFIEMIDKPTKVKVGDIGLAFLPYDKTENITYKLISGLKSDYLFSHIDIKGSALRGSYIMDTGVEPEWLAENFKITINGHLHTPEIINTSQNEVRNIGSVSSISFVDSNSYIPSICVLDTDTGKIRRYKNPASILFRKIEINSVNDLMSYIRSLDEHKYILHITCPQNIRDDLKNILESNENKILTYRIVTNMKEYDYSKADGVEIEKLNDTDIKAEFLKFLAETGMSTADINKYNKVLSIEV